MIDLSQSRAGLLAEIEARDPAGDPVYNLTDPRIATADAHVRVHGRGREDLFPLLKLALAERFAAAPRLQLIRDLLIPLRNALGNAYKHGNGSDPAKTVWVEITLTRKGALIAITDEGTGFDVALTFRRFQEQQSYFLNHGVGFINLHGARATVSYENGGRTVLLCFRPTDDTECASFFCPASAGDQTTTPGESPGAPSHSLESGSFQTCLSAEPLDFGNGPTWPKSCRIYATRGPASDTCGVHYALQVVGHDGLLETRVLTGRLHTSAASAAADFEAATLLREANISKSVLIPRPVARPAEEPRFVLYDFDPWMNLWEYFTYRGRLKSLRHGARRIGRALARLHRSRVMFPGVEPDPFEERLQAILLGAETALQTLPAGSQLVNQFRVAVQWILERAAFGRRQFLAPVHGAFGWDCVQYGTDGQFYLYRFERCRWSDPGLDLGGFAADLLCFTLASGDESAYRIGCDALLSKYNSEAEHPMAEDELPFYVALALSERLRHLEPRTRTQAGLLLTALDATLAHGGRSVTNKVSP
jgi:anti-sigma regulatory factor (Ser/Thr protein kinase)